MTSTDATIEIQCWDCEEDHLEQGIEAMEKHLLTVHSKNYSVKDAQEYARRWADYAYEKEEEFLADYYKQRKEDPSE